jgi:hypothetical protein
MLIGERVVLRPIQRGGSPSTVGTHLGLRGRRPREFGAGRARSLAQFEAGFDQDLTKHHNDRAYFGIEVDGELIGEAGLHRIDHFSRVCEFGIGIGREFWARGSGRTRSGRWSTTRSSI